MRRYPFTEELPNVTSSASNVTVQPAAWRITTYQTNPFHGVDRIVFAVDEWGHRVLPVRFHRLLLGLLCDWWEKRVR